MKEREIDYTMAEGKQCRIYHDRVAINVGEDTVIFTFDGILVLFSGMVILQEVRHGQNTGHQD